MEEKLKITLNVFGWIFGVIFSFLSFIFLFDKTIFVALLLLAMGFLLIPKSSKLLKFSWKIKTFIFVVLFISFILIQSPEKSKTEVLETQNIPQTLETKIEGELTTATVKRVIDGDTLELDNGNKVRLICIDTPEIGQPYFQEAKSYLESLVLNKKILLEKDISETD